MKKTAYFVLSIGLLLLTASQPQNHVAEASLTVILENCASDKGKIYIALYNSSDTYMKINKATAKKVVSIRNKSAIIKFENLPTGTYAFSCYHDANDNGRLDTNFMGIPREDYAFSNNARGTFGPPAFEKSKFELKDKNLKMTISF
jgi:uncharacterized protein (DUF2141 family)